MPVFWLNGVPVLYCASWKAHYSLYPASDALVAAFTRAFASFAQQGRDPDAAVGTCARAADLPESMRKVVPRSRRRFVVPKRHVAHILLIGSREQERRVGKQLRSILPANPATQHLRHYDPADDRRTSNGYNDSHAFRHAR